jgi:protein phosphatase PTC2/3
MRPIVEKAKVAQKV